MARADRIFAGMSLAAVVFLMTMVNLTTPSDVGPFGVLVFFTLIYLVCLGVMVGLCRVFFAVRGKVRGVQGGTNHKRSYYFASILAFAPMLLIFMRSFGELNLLEIFLVAFFAVIGCFYISKRT